MLKFLSVVGARPQFIKAALVSRKLRKKNEEILLHTGQHYDREMSQNFFNVLDMPEPDYNLGVGSSSHARQTGRMLVGIEGIISKEEPDCVIVYGDTNSTLAGALAAVKLGIMTAHVEAGLRSYNRAMPEEINRVMIDHISDILFCPTRRAVENLGMEGISKGIHFVGDVMFDLAMIYKPLAAKRRLSKEMGLKRGKYILVTVHRPSNTDNKKTLTGIVGALLDCDQEMVFPAHPRTVKCLKRFGLYEKLKKGIIITKPLDYIDFLSLLVDCGKVATDSGGVQKEAYFFEKPCITLREETEWVETVEDGWNILVGSYGRAIKDAIRNFRPRKNHRKHYGDGKAVGKMCRILEEI